MTTCTHLNQIQEVTASANGCEECLIRGTDGCICANVFFADTSGAATLQKTNTPPII